MASDSVKPIWKFKTSYDIAKWILESNIVKITHHWEFTGEDTARHWLELHNDKKEKRVSPYLSEYDEVKFKPDHRTLVQVSDAVRELIIKIENWEKQNQKELAEYARLKNKLGL